MTVKIHDTDSDQTTEHQINGNLSDDAWDLVKAADGALGVAGDMPYSELVIAKDIRAKNTRKIVVNWRNGRGSTGTYTFR